MKFALLLFFSLMSLNTFSQGVQVYDPRGAGAAVISPPPKVQVKPATEDEQEIEDLERELREQNKKLGAASDILDVEESSAKDKGSLAPDQEKARDQLQAKGMLGQNTELFELQTALNEGKSAMDIIQDPVLRGKLVKAYKVNPMSMMPKEALRGMLQQQIEGSPLGTVTKQFPFVLDFLVNFMHHPTALSQSVKILDRPDDLKTCGIVSLILMVVIYFLRRGSLKDDPPIGKIIGVKLLSSLIFLSLSVGFLYYTFMSELDPLIEVIKESI